MNIFKQSLLILLFQLPLLSSVSTVGLSDLLEPLEVKVPAVPKDADRAQLEEEVVVPSSKMISITKEDAVEALLRVGRSAIQSDDSLEIAIKSGWEPFSLPEGEDWELSVVDHFAPDNRGRWSPSLVLEVDGKVENRWRLNSKVDLYRRVYMTTQRLGRGETPMRPGIQAVVCNIYDETSRPVPVSENLRNFEMVRTLGAGQFLTWDDVSPRRAVRKGETVEVVLEKGALSITMQAMCLQDGLVEETVRLRNPTSRTEFAGIVKAPGVVVVAN